jgi:hypothetical protein
MNISSSRRRLCVGGWILAALVLAGVNGWAWLSLESQALVGNSPTIKSLQQKLARLQAAKAREGRQMEGIGPGVFEARYTPRSAPETQPPTADPRPRDAAPEALPVLTGVVGRLTPQGGVEYAALLDRRLCRIRDRVGDFVVERISPSGVMLRRAGQEWFVEAPQPYHSSQRGD